MMKSVMVSLPLTFSRSLRRARLRQFVFKYSSKLVFGQPQRCKPFDGRLHHGLSLAHHPRSPSRFLDERSGAVLQLEDSFVFQLPVRADHGIGVHDQVLGDLADGRELIALPQRACFHRVLHLLHELEVERNAGGLVEPEDHVCCQLIHYTDNSKSSSGFLDNTACGA